MLRSLVVYSEKFSKGPHLTLYGKIDFDSIFNIDTIYQFEFYKNI